jgi:hypothetical protein
MSTFALFVATLAPAIFVAAALAQTQLPPPAGRSSPPRPDDAGPGPGIGERGRGSNREYRSLQDGDNPE